MSNQRILYLRGIEKIKDIVVSAATNNLWCMRQIISNNEVRKFLWVCGLFVELGPLLQYIIHEPPQTIPLSHCITGTGGSLLLDL